MRIQLPIAIALCLLVLSACQKRGEPLQLPTQDQWRRIQENLLAEAPTPMHDASAVFADHFRLIGWDVEPETVEIGESFAMTFYWEVLKPLDERWQIFVHLDAGGQRQNLDHEAMGGTYPTQQWAEGEIIRDHVTGVLDTALPAGDVEVFLGFWRGEDRLEITDPGSGRVMEDGRLRVGAFPAAWTPPSLEIRRATAPIAIDGRGTDRAWSRAQRTAAWVNPVNGESVEGGDAWAKLLWDDANLYVLMHARDPDVWATLTERDANLWDEEVLELYLDPNGDGQDYLELQLNPLGTVFDAVFPESENRDLASARAVDIEGMVTAVHVSGSVDDRTDADRSWSAEVRIPLASLPGWEAFEPGADAEVRLNLYRYDRPADVDGPVTSAWSPVGPGSFHRPARFGVGTFVGRFGEGTTGLPPSLDGSGEGSGDAVATPELSGQRGLRRLPPAQLRGTGRQPSQNE